MKGRARKGRSVRKDFRRRKGKSLINIEGKDLRTADTSGCSDDLRKWRGEGAEKRKRSDQFSKVGIRETKESRFLGGGTKEKLCKASKKGGGAFISTIASKRRRKERREKRGGIIRTKKKISLTIDRAT